MDATLDSLLLGFSVAFRPDVLLYAFIGCLVGTLVGVLPGVGPLAGISSLLVLMSDGQIYVFSRVCSTATFAAWIGGTVLS